MMKSPFILKLPSGISSLVTFIKWRTHNNKRKLQYANSKRLSAKSIKLFRQYFCGFAFYLEQIAYYIKESLVLKVRVERPSLIFIYVITGDVQITVPGHNKNIVIEQRQCFAHLIPAGDYYWKLQKGRKKFLYFTLLPEWLLKMQSEYPGLVKFIQNMQKRNVSNTILPAYTMSTKTLAQLDRIRNCKARGRLELEEKLFNTINKLVKEYQEYLTAPNQLVHKSNRQTVHEVRDHIIDLVEKGILPFVMDVSTNFNIESKTLRRFCLKEFGMNVQELITDAQMKKAYAMLKRGMAVKDVTLGLGYSDLSVFSRKFKIYFGYSPGTVVSDKDS